MSLAANAAGEITAYGNLLAHWEMTCKSKEICLEITMISNFRDALFHYEHLYNAEQRNDLEKAKLEHHALCEHLARGGKDALDYTAKKFAKHIDSLLKALGKSSKLGFKANLVDFVKRLKIIEVELRKTFIPFDAIKFGRYMVEITEIFEEFENFSSTNGLTVMRSGIPLDEKFRKIN